MGENNMAETKSTGLRSDTSTFDLQALAGKFPPTADTMLLDMRLTDEPAASSRLFRIYQPAPAHYHKTCDEYLQVISGRGKFVVDGGSPVELGPGQLLFFRRNVVHSIPEVVEGPLVVFSVDTPRRDPADVTFVDPRHGTAANFIRTIEP
jgi:mannose-6-phosphate isomerase-like protein (cupin superfamily)